MRGRLNDATVPCMVQNKSASLFPPCLSSLVVKDTVHLPPFGRERTKYWTDSLDVALAVHQGLLFGDFEV